ncbi:MAG TPA: 3-oxoacyl-ACP reductase family protein [Terriglobia bacterium]|nr:3-oxoacyl-ACP reductase family protein [Terriglobia bacterium]
MARLTGKVALVTGGARGIGAAITRQLGEEGAAVAFTYLASQRPAETLAKEIEAAGGQALAIRADSGAADQVKAAVTRTAQHFGRLDILVNNAGIELPGTIADYSVDDFDRMVEVNIKGVFVATQEAVRHMKDGGRIINIGSVSSDYMPIAGHAIYAMTKGAIASLTRGLARDLGSRGITVNNVQPGRIETDMIAAVLKAPGGDKIHEAIALKRFGKSEEAAGLVAYLAGPEAAFITGANLKVDGGVSA